MKIVSPRPGVDELETRIAELLSQDARLRLYVSVLNVRSGACYRSEASSSAYFSLGSLTKALVTAPLVWTNRTAVQRVLRRLPPLAAGRWRADDVDALVSHRSGLASWNPLWMQGGGGELACGSSFQLDDIHQLVEARGLAAPVGPYRSLYSDLGYLYLGYALEEASGGSLWQTWCEVFGSMFGAEVVAEFSPGPALVETGREAVSTGWCGLRQRSLVGEVHDANAWWLGGGVLGHTGLFGTGTGCENFLRLWLNNSRGFVEANQKVIAVNGRQRGLQPLWGWCWAGPGSTGYAFGQGRSLGHLGYVGTAFWFCPVTSRLGIVLSNRVIRRGGSRGWFDEVRRRLFAAMGEVTLG